MVTFDKACVNPNNINNFTRQNKGFKHIIFNLIKMSVEIDLILLPVYNRVGQTFLSRAKLKKKLF